MKPVRFCSLFICHEQPNKHFVVCIGWVSSTSTYECATAVAKLASRRTWTMMMALGAVPSTFCVLVIWCVFWSSHFHQRRMVAWRWVGRWAWVWHRTEVKWSPCVRTIGVLLPHEHDYWWRMAPTSSGAIDGANANRHHGRWWREGKRQRLQWRPCRADGRASERAAPSAGLGKLQWPSSLIHSTCRPAHESYLLLNLHVASVCSFVLVSYFSVRFSSSLSK